MKARLLFPDREPGDWSAFLGDPATLVQDLELETLLEAMADGDPFLHAAATDVLLSGLDDPAQIHYRQAVLADCLEQPGVVREMYQIAAEAFEGKRRIFGALSKHPTGILTRSVQELELFAGLLRRLRVLADRYGSGFRSEGMTTLMGVLGRELDDDYFDAIDDHLRRLAFRSGVLLSAGLGPANQGADLVLRSPRVVAKGWKARVGIGAEPSHSFEINARDDESVRAVGELRDRGINLVANALAQSMDHVLDFLTQLRSELGFYVGCVNLHERLTGSGEPVCLPVPRPWSDRALSASGLYDACLSLTVDGRVVGNDLAADGRTLVLITGANSGGKSTFLRSLGLAQLMLQCGMFVAADRFEASVCGGLFTHFLRREDSSMTSGKLDEELRRMSAIADAVRPRCMVLLNESFSSTNERDGSEIARQTVHALVDSDIRVCFVTHLFDLADRLRAEDRAATLFLRAERGEDGHRSFAVVEGDPLPTSFGEDLYLRVFAPHSHPEGPSPSDPGAGRGSSHRGGG